MSYELHQIEKELHEIAKYLRQLAGDFAPRRLTRIRIAFREETMPQGPVVLNQGQSATATVLYFDQQGNPMPSTFVPPSVTFAMDNPAIASSTPGSDGQSDVVAYVSAGVANLTATVTSAEGVALQDTETVTCNPVAPPTPVLSSVKIAFSTPTP